MILYNLCCSADHVFEAWFRDSAAFDEQAVAGEILCPVCGNASVAKAPMAPRIAKGGDSGDDRGEESGPGPQTYTNTKATEMRRMLTELRRHVEDNSDYVGDSFAEEARKIHYGETEERNIYGEATEDQAEELTEEGVKVGRIPWLPRTDS
ncbi:MAG: DUF1178 family protein [Proteobacteria bacterium]|nr:DUF1178 family protein [Pseudomonadota bacterium]